MKVSELTGHFISEPLIFGTSIETWEEHLAALKTLPKTDPSRDWLIRDAKRTIAMKRKCQV